MKIAVKRRAAYQAYLEACWDDGSVFASVCLGKLTFPVKTIESYLAEGPEKAPALFETVMEQAIKVIKEGRL